MRHHGKSDIRLQQRNQVTLRRNFMTAVDIDAVLAQRIVEAARMFAIVARQQLFVAQILETNPVAARQRVPLVDDEVEVFGEQRPGIEAVPVLADLGGDAELGFAFFQEFTDLVAGAAQKSKLEPVELSLDLVEMIMSLEEEFGVEIPDEDAEQILTVGDAISYIDTHTKPV